MTSSPIIIHNGIAYSIEDKIPKELVEILLNRFSSIREPPISNLSHIYTLKDFENAAFEKLKPETWAYYRTGADDEITLRENVAAFQRVFFRPRILQNVAQVDQSTMFFSTETSSPFYISAFAGSKLGHEYAEKNFSWAANKTGIVQMIPLMSKYPFDEIADELDERDAWLQIYIDSNREVADALINRAIVRGIKAIFFTVDSAQIGNREFESRLNGTTFKQRLLHDPSLTWDDIAAYKKKLSKHNIKVILKGVQCKEDAIKAFKRGIDGVLISNHGGRQLDTTRSSIEVLEEVVQGFDTELITREIRGDFSIFLDGGVRRGSDVVKALCLGASGVGLGRLFLYAMTSFGKDGVVKAINILKNEIDCCLRLLGVNNIAELHPGLIDTSNLKNRLNK